MSKKRRTKAKKIASQARAVKGQFQFSFKAGSVKTNSKKKSEISERSDDLASIKKDLIKSLIIASLITGSILVLYWVS